MGIPAKSRWWIVTLLIVGVLWLISALALDRPNVVWTENNPHCPHCRHQVRDYSHRCGDCGGEFDWFPAAEDDSPISPHSLSILEDEWIRERVKALGEEEAARRVASALGLSREAATEFLASVGRGDCGWCGGTAKDLAPADPESDEPCPACLGTGNSVACGGDRRVRIGDQSAYRALEAYRAEMNDLRRSQASTEAKREEIRRLAEKFLSAHAGTMQADEIEFWLTYGTPAGHGAAPVEDNTVVNHCRARLDQILAALRQSP